MPYTAPTTIEEAIKECQPSLNKLASKFTRNHYQDRNDFIQQGMIGIMKAWDKYDPSVYNNKFSTYAHMKIFHEMQQYAYKSWGYKNNTADLVEGYNDDIQNSYSINEDIIDVERRVTKLPEEYQEIFSLRQAGYTFSEIAELTEKKSLHEARNIFKEVEAHLSL